MEPTLPLHPPPGWGPDAVTFLESRGLVARTPAIHQSDYGAEPFLYYLTRRLGITSALRYSSVLTRGSWYHLWAEHDWDPSTTAATVRLPQLLTARHQELRDVCRTFGIVGDSIQRVLDRETKDYHAARTYHDATTLVPVTADGRTVREVLTGPNFTLLGIEVPLSFTHPTYGPLAGRIDALLLHNKTGALWIVDRKTTGYAPRLRASLCPEEMQTWHYLFIVRELLKNDDWRRTLGLPPNTPLGGMLHDIVQKCPLNFAACDRDFTLDTSPLKSGPRKGEPRNEKVYNGEPRYDNYLARVRQWYGGGGDYEHLLKEREVEGPPCNISYTSSSILDDDLLLRYHTRLASVHTLATRAPVPRDFPSYPSTSALPHGKATAFSPFYLLPPREWPDAMTRGRLTTTPLSKDPDNGTEPTDADAGPQ